MATQQAGETKTDPSESAPGGVVDPGHPAVAEAVGEAPPKPEEAAAALPATRDPAWAAYVVIAGIVAVVVALGITIWAFDTNAQNVVAITGPAFAVITGLVAAYFGVRAGSLAADRVQGAAANKPPPGTSEKLQMELLKRNGGSPKRNGLRRNRRNQAG
jgi:hypothetical protein